MQDSKLKRCAVAVVSLLLLAGSIAPAMAQSSAPKTCLVLSGGGARGAAHIGVLKVLDELRIPVDCIVGTSMGAIVGGAYAAGVSPERMEEVIRNARWDLVLADNPDRRQRSVRTKELQRQRIQLAEFGLRGRRAVLPRGAVIGQQLDVVLQDLYGIPNAVKSFDTLPIPFRALATDIENGQMVVIGEGSLNDAVRASMSVPGAFAPHDINGRLLVDGGLVRNLGVDVARALGARRIIAVNLGTTLSGREALESLVGVTTQMINILTEQNVQTSLAQLGPQDLLISPDLGDFGVIDFAAAATVIELGEQAARALTEPLRAFAVPEEQYRSWRNASSQRQLPSAIFARVEVDTSGLRFSNRDSARAAFESEQRRAPEETRIERGVAALYATDDFQQVSVSLRSEPDGSNTLLIQPREKSWGPNYARLGVTLSTNLEGDSAFTLLGDYRATWLNDHGLEWRTTASLGDINLLRSELLLPLDLRREWFVAARVEVQQRVDGQFAGEEEISRFRNSGWRGALDAGRRFGTSGDLRFGIEQLRFKSVEITGNAPRVDAPRDAAGLFARLTLDRLDNWDFPRAGYFASARFDYTARDFGGDLEYQKLIVDLQRAFGRDRHSVNLALRHGDSFGSNLPAVEAISLGGFQNLSGLRERQILAERATFARASYRYQIGGLGALTSSLYVGVSLEAARIEDRINALPRNDTINAGSLFIAADTVLGPVYFGAGLAEGGESAMYLFLGRP